MIGIYIDSTSTYYSLKNKFDGKLDYLKILEENNPRYCATVYGSMISGGKSFKDYLQHCGYDVNFIATKKKNNRNVLPSRSSQIITDSMANMFSGKVTKSVFITCDWSVFPTIEYLKARGHAVKLYSVEALVKLQTMTEYVELNEDYLLGEEDES